MDDQKKIILVPHPKRILVAEDDKFYATLYKKRLTEEGFEVIIATDGEEALKELRTQKPNLLILDIIMPVKDGFEVLKEMKTDESLKSVPVLVVTNLGQEEDTKQAIQLGAVDYVVKANIPIYAMIDIVKKYVN